MLKNELKIFFPQKEFFSNEVVKGYCELKLPEALEIIGLDLTFSGIEFGSWQQKNVKETNTFYLHEEVLIGPGSSLPTYDWLGRKKRPPSKLKEGTYKYPFQIQLPVENPPCYNSANAKISYQIKIEVLSANTKMTNLIATAQVPVGGSLYNLNFIGNNSNPVKVNEKRTFLLSKGVLDITLELQSGIYLAGDKMKLKLTMDNQTSKTISNITVSIVQIIQLYIYGSKYGEAQNNLGKLQLGNLNAKELKSPNNQITIPKNIPETISKLKITNKSKETIVGKILQVRYEIQFYGEVSLGTDVKFEVPFYVVRRAEKKEEETKVKDG